MSKSIKFGRYELIRKIATGGMGEVYLARTKGAAGFEKKVVIKKILKQYSNDPKFVERFIDEGKILVKLTHGNIVPIFDLGVYNGEYYLAIEYIEGLDLRELLKILKEKNMLLPWEISSYIVMEVSKGLSYAHARCDEKGRPLNIIHRDISPSNIMISTEGDVKIVDFGIAKTSRSLHTTISGFIEGKFYYMSPEQAKGEKLTRQSDLFSLGVVFYELLTGMRPFDGENELQVLEKIKTEEPLPPSYFNSHIPQEIESIVLKMLKKDRGERYASGTQIIEDIQKVFIENSVLISSVKVKEFLEKHGIFKSARKKPKKSFDDILKHQLEEVVREEPLSEISIRTKTISKESEKNYYKLLFLLLSGFFVLFLFGMFFINRSNNREDKPKKGVLLKKIVLPKRLMEESSIKSKRWGPATGLKVVKRQKSVKFITFSRIEPDISVFINGVKISKFPYPVPDSGKLKIRLIKNGYSPYELELEASKIEKEHVLKVPVFTRKILLSSVPKGASVRTLSGKKVGTTPVYITVKENQILPLLIVKEGYFSKNIEINEKKTGSTVKVILNKKGRGTLVFRFFPASSSVFLNGKKIDTKNRNVVKLKLPEGRYVLKIVTPDGRVIFNNKVEIKRNKTVNLETIK